MNLIERIYPCGLHLKCRICDSVQNYHCSYSYNGDLFHYCKYHTNEVKEICENYIKQNLAISVENVIVNNIISDKYNFNVKRSSGRIENGWKLCTLKDIFSTIILIF